ncbi:MAG TPA: RtcB family protein [Dehalococcoidia bacterium]|jgi:tRNA-splicing ligase RtcB|nr:RtcB family protein [Dehalococcoidia bacterium]
MSAPWQEILKKIDDYRWEIPRSYKAGMSVPGLIYASEAMLNHIWEEQVFQQVANVAFLPGIIDHSLAMPDIHWGYGFPIGGVAATRVKDGVVSPGGVGFDINCGVRLLRTNLTKQEVKPKIEQLITELFVNIPSGLGSTGKLRVSEKELDQVLIKGSRWAAEKGYGEAEDIVATEESGCMKRANPDKVSSKAKKRGIPQLGTLGSGNHFLEVEVVDEIYDPEVAKVMGIEDLGQILILIHTGSRGFGHEVCSDYIRVLGEAVRKYGIALPDRQLACAPVESPEGQDYLQAMACAANYAWTNRQCITHWVRQSFIKVFGKSRKELGMEQIYDVTHNIAKIEEYPIDGKKQTLCVHRKGATRAFPAGSPDIPDIYKSIGQPVLIPGDMGRCSYILVGTETAMKESFGSTCHGAGRIQSRTAAKRSLRGADVAKALAARGIIVKAGSMGSLAEEASEAYKDVTEVVDVTHKAGISHKVARARPLGVIKG